MNKLSISMSKTKEMQSLRSYNPPSSTVHIEQVSQAQLLGVFLTPAYSMLTYVNYITIMSQRLHVKLIDKKSLDIKCHTELFVGLVIARFQYALPAFAGQ